MLPVTLVMAYYDNPQMLREQVGCINALGDVIRDALHLVVVDDGSPRWPAAQAVDPASVKVPYQLYRMDVDVRWNQDACRNVAMRHIETNWALLTDIDHVVPEQTWHEVMAKERDYKFVAMLPRVSAPDMSPYKHHPNTWFLSRKMYDEVGGYDERFAGLYGTDGDFAARLKQLTEIRWFKQPVIRVGRSVVEDASTTTYLRKQPEDREGLDRVRRERAALKEWVPLRYRFKYHREFPT